MKTKNVKFIDRERMDSISHNLIQIGLTALPIAGGIAVYLSQRPKSAFLILFLGAICVGAFILAWSILLNLGVLRQPDAITNDEKTSLHEYFYRSIHVFLIGTFILVLSPVLFAIEQMGVSSSLITLNTPSNSIPVNLSEHQPQAQTTFIVSNNGVLTSALEIRFMIEPSNCITVDPKLKSIRIAAGDTQLIIANLSFDTACVPGNYVLLAEVLHDNTVVETAWVTLVLKH